MISTLSKPIKKVVFSVLIITLLTSCSGVSINDYAQIKPAIKLDSFFSGELVAYGIVRDRSGRVIRLFNAELVGSWQDGIGTLDEIFWFNDGEQQTRVWTMSPTKDGNYIGTASDVEGNALIQTQGNAINLRYQLRIPYKGKEITIDMDDWMYQVAPGIVINETTMHKWGLQVGTITLTIIKKENVKDLLNTTL